LPDTCPALFCALDAHADRRFAQSNALRKLSLTEMGSGLRTSFKLRGCGGFSNSRHAFHARRNPCSLHSLILAKICLELKPNFPVCCNILRRPELREAVFSRAFLRSRVSAETCEAPPHPQPFSLEGRRDKDGRGDRQIRLPPAPFPLRDRAGEFFGAHPKKVGVFTPTLGPQWPTRFGPLPPARLPQGASGEGVRRSERQHWTGVLNPKFVSSSDFFWVDPKKGPLF
jgi:hypothetical protein